MKRLLLISTIILACCAHLKAQTGTFIPSERFSSSLISNICQDSYGYIWVGTDYGLNRYDGYSFVTFLHDEADSTSMAVNVVTSLFCDRSGQLWVGTNMGLDRYDAPSRSFIHYPFPGGLRPRVSSILQRRDGTMLFGTAGYGAYALNGEGRLERFSLEGSDDYFSRFFEDSRGRLWRSGFDDKIGMRVGDKVTRFNSDFGSPLKFLEYGDEMLTICQHGIMSYRNGQMKPAAIGLGSLAGKDFVFTTAAISPDGVLYVGTRGMGVYRVTPAPDRHLERVSISAFGIDPYTSFISAAMFDRRGNMWLGCHRRGLLTIPLQQPQFSSWSFEGQGIRLGSPVSSVCEGDNGLTWCTVQGVGVFGFNPQGQVVARPSAPQAVEDIYRDRQNRYWIGTDDGLFAYDPLTGRYEQKVKYDCDRINNITSDADGRIYFSAFSRGFCVYDPATGRLLNHNFSEDSTSRGRLCNNWVMSMSTDRQGLIWMGTASGVSCYDPRSDSFTTQGWNSLLSDIVCFEVCELHSGKLADGRKLEGDIAIGTEAGLYLYDRQSRTAVPFPGSEALRNKVVSYIVQSNDGDIWCSTSAGIWQYSLKTHKFIGHVSGNGLTQKEFLYGVGMHSDDDIIYFGHNDGLTVFSPKSLKRQVVTLDTLRLVNFIVGGEPVSSRTELNGVRVTKLGVGESDHFTLSYLDHTITLAFSQLTFENTLNAQFQYRVNGGEWNNAPEGVNSFTLSQLQPGTYRIDVRAEHGTEYTPVKTVTVTIRAPWYRSRLAYLIYILIAVALLGMAALLFSRRAREQLNEDKMKFLINATHDIRSPLTLIMSPLNNLKRHIGQEQREASRDIDTIERNAQRILNLVNQILDVRKIDKQQMHLHCQQTDLVSFTRGICKMFEYSAQERKIQFNVNVGDLQELQAWVDRSQFDKVVSNLLSNAFKYCAEGGQVEVLLSGDESNARLQVLDNGVGLDEDTLKHIFERFYQGGNSRRMNIKGTGIGLNLCKMIVDMHHGTISAANRSDGQRGSVFTVTLPLGNAHLKASEIEQDEPVVSTEAPAATVPAAAETTAAASKAQKVGNRRRVLLVDDDPEIGQYISNELGRYYKFTLCKNGREGLKELLTNDYDLVVSDVMMPEMDGFTMLRLIKTNVNVSDVPVIMLTSKADVSNRLEGLERGADAFLAKPFDLEELHMNIENLLQGRQRLKGKYSGAQLQADKIAQPEVKGNDELLMERIMKAINKNLGDSDFNVDILTKEVGISRAQLHRKMKEMTGISTSEFLRNIRLEQAARLLREQKINVTQVAYTVGFSNLAHFSTIFRKHFGITPSEYAEQQQG